MKSLSLARPLVIMTIGIPGSGKSFFARQFSEMFDAPLISNDFVRHTLFPESVYTREEDALVSDITLQQLEELLRTKKTLVYDGGCNPRGDRVEIEKMARASGYGTLVIWVQTDLPTAQMRSEKRNNRRAGDLLNSPMDTDTFQALTRRFTQPHPKEDYVVISGKHTYAAQARVVLKKLVTARTGASSNQPLIIPPAQTQTRSIRHDIQPQTRNNAARS